MDKWFMAAGPDCDTVLNSRVRLLRNFQDIPFPWRMNDQQCRTAEKKICSAVFNTNSMLSDKFKRVDMEKASETEAVSLVERCLADADFISMRKGRDVLLNGDDSVCIMVNGDSHLILQVLSPGSDLSGSYAKADTIDTVLNKSLHFAFDKELGYLTPNPMDLGTGMTASLLLHLPALTDLGSATRISANLSKIGLSMHGVYGSAVKPLGALYLLSNRVTLGLSERQVLSNLHRMSMQVISRERSARKELAGDIKVQDSVFRSLGIMRNARFMTNNEFFDFASVLRFGIESGIINDMNYECIDSLIFKVQPATLTLSAGRPLTSAERSIARADAVRAALNQQ